MAIKGNNEIVELLYVGLEKDTFENKSQRKILAAGLIADTLVTLGKWKSTSLLIRLLFGA